MGDYCENCGCKLNKNDEFCPDCGSPMKSPQKDVEKSNRTIIIALLIVIVLIMVGLVATKFTLIQNDQPELERCDFGYLTMSVPKGSDFVEYSSVGKGTAYWAIGYTNEGEGDTDLMIVWISTYDGTSIYDYLGRDGDLDIFDGELNTYIVQRNVGGYYVQLTGSELDDLKQMARSIQLK